MPFYNFIWTEVAEEYIDQHGISVADFEGVVSDPVSTGVSRSSGRDIAFGYTDDGREIVCIYELLDDFDVLPITAYEVG